MEFYLLNYFKPATYKQDQATRPRREPDESDRVRDAATSGTFPLEHDRRVADVQTVYDPEHAIFNNLFATATGLFNYHRRWHRPPAAEGRRSGEASWFGTFFSDLKRHDLGPNFHERNYNGTLQTGVPDHASVGSGEHRALRPRRPELELDGGDPPTRRRGGRGRATPSPRSDGEDQARILAFLELAWSSSRPDDTASNLDAGDPRTPNFPQFGHGSIKLTVLFNDPSDKE